MGGRTLCESGGAPRPSGGPISNYYSILWCGAYIMGIYYGHILYYHLLWGPISNKILYVIAYLGLGSRGKCYIMLCYGMLCYVIVHYSIV